MDYRTGYITQWGLRFQEPLDNRSRRWIRKAVGESGDPKFRAADEAAQFDHRFRDLEWRAARNDVGGRKLFHQPQYPRHALNWRNNVYLVLGPGLNPERHAIGA